MPDTAPIQLSPESIKVMELLDAAKQGIVQIRSESQSLPPVIYQCGEAIRHLDTAFLWFQFAANSKAILPQERQQAIEDALAEGKVVNFPGGQATPNA